METGPGDEGSGRPEPAPAATDWAPDEDPPPGTVRERAESAGARAAIARQRAATARERADEVRARMTAMGVEPGQPVPVGAPVLDPGVLRSLSRLDSEGERLRAEAALLSDSMADQAERFADQLEHLATRGDAERRLELADAERRIARIQRRNAGRLRRVPRGGTPLESLPDLPGFSRHGKGSPKTAEEPHPADEAG